MDEIEIEPKSWPEIAEFYRTLISEDGWKIQPMLRLVEQIAVSEYAAGMFPYTSMSTLCIAHSHRVRRFREELQITYDPIGRQFHFEYWSDPFVRSGPWRRTCNESDGFAILERCLLKRIRWFKKESSHDQTQSPPSADQPANTKHKFR
jgi:hypothetical protein